MSVARFVADQRTVYRVPVAFTCLILGLSVSWFYKWRERQPTKTERRRVKLDAAVAREFTSQRGLHGSPRLYVDLRQKGWVVTEKTVADSMRRQGLVARKIKRRNGLTVQDKAAPKFPDLVRRDFTATAANVKWVGDIQCRRRHWMSYADLRTMPMLFMKGSGGEAFGVGCRHSQRVASQARMSGSGW